MPAWPQYHARFRTILCSLPIFPIYFISKTVLFYSSTSRDNIFRFMLLFRNVTRRHWACAGLVWSSMAVPWSRCWRSSAGAAVLLDWCCGLSRRAFTQAASSGRRTASSTAATQVALSHRCRDDEGHRCEPMNDTWLPYMIITLGLRWVRVSCAVIV